VYGQLFLVVVADLFVLGTVLGTEENDKHEDNKGIDSDDDVDEG
jgi:hypothetical protein